MQADIIEIFHSPLVRVFDFRCKEAAGAVSAPEYSSNFEITFTRTGYFGFRAGRQGFDIDICGVLLHNAGSENVYTHGCEVRDTCTVLRFPEHLLQEARRTYWKKSHSASVPGDAFLFPYPCITSSPSIDTLHLHLYSTTQNNSLGRSTLKLEELATELVKEVFVQIYGQNDSSKYALTNKEREQHLEIIERAKHYMVGDFDQNLSLADVARQAHASVFHFSRIFKQFTHQSPYQYLMDVRLKHAAMLLRNTSLSITEICFSSGFNSFSHFISTFTRRYGQSPSKFRAA